MKDHYDPWYVRLPDGRTIKAKSTASVRHHVEAGHIPLNSQIRRDSNEEWVSLVWVAEFADLGVAAGARLPAVSAAGNTHPRSGVAARLDPLRLHTVGVRGLLDELIAALDSTLTRSKMAPAFVAGVLLWVGTDALRAAAAWLFEPPAWVPLAIAAVFAVVVLSVLNAILARLTHLELSTMRPARLAHAAARFGHSVGPVVLANVVVAGAGLAVIYLVHRAPHWTADLLAGTEMGSRARAVILTSVLVVAYLVGGLMWVVIGLCWLLTPAIVVEESSALAGVREWRQLLRDHFGRIVVYEGLTLMLGLAISLPLALAAGLVVHWGPGAGQPWPADLTDEMTWVAGTAASVMYGLAAAPLLALLPVANLFIYLNLRYEQAPAR